MTLTLPYIYNSTLNIQTDKPNQTIDSEQMLNRVYMFAIVTAFL